MNIQSMVKGVASLFVWSLLFWASFNLLMKAHSRLGSPLPLYLNNLLTGMASGLWFLGIVAIIALAIRKKI